MNLQSVRKIPESKTGGIQTGPRADPSPGHVESDNRRLSRPCDTQPVQAKYPFLIMLGLAHLGAGLTLLPWCFSWTGVVSAIVGIYVFGLLGINVCFHRLLSHRSFECPKWFEYTLATLGTCCLQESPAWWTAVHRYHHRHADEQNDPHSPRVGFFWAHAGWLLVKCRQFDERERMYPHVRDLMRQPFYAWLDCKRNGVLVLILQAIVYLSCGFLIGWIPHRDGSAGIQLACSVLVWGVFLRTVLVQHLTWTVNSICHRWGYRNFETRDDSRNNLVCGIFVHGEGWHNNHHAYPLRAQHGLKWWEIDTAYWAICLFEKLGLVWNVRREITGIPESQMKLT